MENSQVIWRKSSRSAAGQECIELGYLKGNIAAMRDSKNPAGPILTGIDLGGFLTTVKSDPYNAPH